MQIRDKERNKITDKIRYDKDKEKISLQHKLNYQKNKEKKKAYSKLYNSLNKEKLRKYRNEYNWRVRGVKRKVTKVIDKNSSEYKNHVLNVKLKKSYNITLNDYNTILDKQNNCCAICGNPEVVTSKNKTTLRLSVDHCHKTGNVRGLLCGKCNRGIGNFNDDINLLQNAIEYTKQF